MFVSDMENADLQERNRCQIAFILDLTDVGIYMKYYQTVQMIIWMYIYTS